MSSQMTITAPNSRMNSPTTPLMNANRREYGDVHQRDRECRAAKFVAAREGRLIALQPSLGGVA